MVRCRTPGVVCKVRPMHMNTVDKRSYSDLHNIARPCERRDSCNWTQHISMLQHKKAALLGVGHACMVCLRLTC